MLVISMSACDSQSQTQTLGDPNTSGQMDSTPTDAGHASDGEHKYTNSLINETSPYLLQHAHNPVNWYAWGDEALEKAKNENKLVLVSIGYSACHWCHVMEHESFEDETVAAYMNEHFVCIKVDREERPDVDQVYMNAVQLISGSGGWPLNCFALPDGRPVHGGTYFPTQQWMELLGQLSQFWTDKPSEMVGYAERLTQGIKESGLITLEEGDVAFEAEQLDKMVNQWSQSFDNREGGPNRAPKFPLPNNYEFLLKYQHLTGDAELLKHVELSLDKMAYGGIYDQIGGGFARYSVDDLWKVPHFEKMLYDNGQLVSLYSEAYQATKKQLYKDVVYQTLEYIEREMTSPEGAFYSALDADSEGVEGKFYVWTEEEIKNLVGEDYIVIKDYYNLNNHGFWEHDNYILLRRDDDEKVAKKHDITVAELREVAQRVNGILLKARAKRVRPGLDDKTLTSWNALMIKGYVDAYSAFGEDEFLQAALKNANFIVKKQWRSDGGLNHSYKAGRSTINGYLEDYSFTIEAFVALYEATFDEEWLEHAKKLADYSIAHFYEKSDGMFYFASDLDKPLIARKIELNDNVIPASNSSIAKAMHVLGLYFDNKQYTSIAKQMLKNVYAKMPDYGPGYSNWGILLLQHVYPMYEVAIVGKDYLDNRAAFEQEYLPNVLYIGSKKSSTLPLLELKYVNGQTTIYVCQNKTCQLPVTEVEAALKQMK